jgi:hypothetical protein
MTKKRSSRDARRVREKMDSQMAMTSDMVTLAQQMAVRFGWRWALFALYTAAIRISSTNGKKNLADLLSDGGW